MRSRHESKHRHARPWQPYSHARQRRQHRARVMHAVYDDSAAVALRKTQPPCERRSARGATRLCTR
eukprot:6452457-Prymnesium_polylepis.1